MSPPSRPAAIKAESIRRISAADEVFKTLHQWIVTGRLSPGDRLPAQDQLARQFAVSRNTLREAINKLSALGLIRARQGIGTVVESSSPAHYISSLYDHLLLDTVTVRELVEARICTERTTVRLAVERADSQDLQRLEAIIERGQEIARHGSPGEFSREDAAFHLALAQASGNRILVKFLEAIWELLQQFIAEVSELPGAVEEAVRYHRKIAAALAARDPERAEQQMLLHLWDVVRRIERNMNLDLGAESLFKLNRPARGRPGSGRSGLKGVVDGLET